mmetsp:Transcript_21711/g.39628  ORF Transcript_21711/g.39628 Transcript_21711/m.39628 type:complete len:1039 (+) Transcript_21711:267-3383(+)
MALPICIYDDASVWPSFSEHIYKRLPLQGVTIRDISFNLVPLSPLYLEFYSFDDNFWKPDDDLYLYMKAYLNIYILSFEDYYEEYEPKYKEKLKHWIDFHDSKAQEWLILYFPCESPSDAMQGKYIKNFDKVWNDLKEITGVTREKHLTRFYSHFRKKYVQLHQPSVNSDEYWHDFFKLITHLIGGSIIKRLDDYTRLIETNAGDFFKCCSHFEGLASIYEMISKPMEATFYYTRMLEYSSTESEFFKECGRKDFKPMLLDTTRKNYRALIASGDINELDFKQYVMARQYLLLKKQGHTLDAGQRVLHFLFQCAYFFNKQKIGRLIEAKWGFQTAKGFADLISEEKLPDENLQNQLRYVIGLLLSYARSRLETLASQTLNIEKLTPNLEFDPEDKMMVGEEGVAHVPEVSVSHREWDFKSIIRSEKRTEELMLNVTSKLKEYFSSCNYTRRAARLQAEKAVLLRRRGEYAKAAELFEPLVGFFEGWPTLQLAVKLQLLECQAKLQNQDSVVMLASEICSKDARAYLMPETIYKAWDVITKTNSHLELYVPDIFNCQMELSSSNLNKDQELTITCHIENYLSQPIKATRLKVTFVGDREFITATDVEHLSKGKTTISYSLSSLQPGHYKHYLVSIRLNGAYLCLPQKPTLLKVHAHSSVQLNIKLPNLLIVDQLQLCIVSIESNSETIHDGLLRFSPASLLDYYPKVEYISYQPEHIRGEIELGVGNVVALDCILPNRTYYMLFRIYQQSEQESFSSRHTIDSSNFNGGAYLTNSFSELFTSKSRELSLQLNAMVVSQNIKLDLVFDNSQGVRETIEYNTNQVLNFIEPFNWHSKLVDWGDFSVLQVVVYHSANIPLCIIDWTLEGAEIIEDLNQRNSILKVGQQWFMSFVLAKDHKHVISIYLTYKYAQAANSNRLYITSEIDELIMEQIFKSTISIQAFDFKVEHSRVGKVGMPYIIKVIVSNVKSSFRASIGLRPVPEWKVYDPKLIEVEVGENEFTIQAISLSRTSDKIPAPYIKIEDDEYEPECDRELCFIESD